MSGGGPFSDGDPFKTLVSQLESLAASLVEAPETEHMIEDLEALPKALAALGRSIDGLDLNDNQRRRMRKSATETLSHLQRSLIYAESRLAHERTELQHQLHDLTLQLDWAKISHQTT